MDLIFDFLKGLFNKNGYRLFMVGGTSRDYLFGIKISDYDFATDATPNEVEKFLEVDSTFEKYGTVKYHYNDRKIDIATLREEGEYKDFRHPSFIKFIKDINLDYKRRDFTINALYIDENYNILDPSGLGVKDLKNRILRIIGNPEERIKEDPLRILRAERFCLEYNLKIDEKTKMAIDNNMDLLELINEGKICEEKRKLNEIKRKFQYEKYKL